MPFMQIVCFVIYLPTNNCLVVRHYHSPIPSLTGTVSSSQVSPPASHSPPPVPLSRAPMPQQCAGSEKKVRRQLGARDFGFRSLSGFARNRDGLRTAPDDSGQDDLRRRGRWPPPPSKAWWASCWTLGDFRFREVSCGEHWAKIWRNCVGKKWDVYGVIGSRKRSPWTESLRYASIPWPGVGYLQSPLIAHSGRSSSLYMMFRLLTLSYF